MCVCETERESVCVCHVCPLPVSAMERKESEKERKRESYFRRDRIPTALLRLMTSRTTKGSGRYLPTLHTYIPLPYTVMRPGSVPVERGKSATSVGLIQSFQVKLM